MKYFYLSIILILITGFSEARQVATIDGTIIDSVKRAIAGASITIHNLSNQVIYKTISDGTGKFSIKGEIGKSYLSVNHIGYIPYRISLTDTTGFLNIVLMSTSQQLKEVIISSSRPFLQQEPDKLLVNVDGNPKAGINALDVLKKIPGVLINRDDITVEGKPIMVLIDGKPTRLSGNSLITLLESSPSTDIGQIEVIYNPSAKYDAAGAGGIINIKTIKRIKPGYDASINFTLGHGWKYPSANGSAGLNYKKGKNNITLNYSRSGGKQYQELQTINKQQDLNQTLLDSSVYNTPYQSQNIRTGFERSLNTKESISALLTGNYSKREPGFTSIAKVGSFSNANDFDYTLSENPGSVVNKGLNLNLSYRYLIDAKKQQELNIDADAGLFEYHNESKNLITQLNNGLPISRNYIQEGKTTSQIYSLKADYTQKIKSGTLETGLKISDVGLENNFSSVMSSQGQPALDYGSNEFHYDETIIAVYGASRMVFGKFSLQLGLRAEQTFTSGISLTLESRVKNAYLNLFPNFSSGFKTGKHAFSLTYGRRIGRPSYSELNPFMIVTGAFSSRTGNPYLNPSYTQNFRLAYVYNSKLNFSTSYSTTKDVITDFQTRDNQDEISKVLKANISSYHNVGFNMSYNNTLFKIWQLNYALGISNSNYRFNYNNVMEQVKQSTGYLSIGNNFQLSKTVYAEIFFYGQARVTYGTYINLPFSTTSFSAGKKIWKGNGNLGISINDIFFTGITRSLRNYGNIDYSVKSKYDSRSIRLNFSYRFGNARIEGRKRNSGSDEEQRRNQ